MMTGQQSSDKTLRDKTIANLEERRNRVLNGSINSIPSPFKRFSNDFIGIEQGTYYTITSFTKGGKSQFTSFVFIYSALMYAYYSKVDIKITILYFALEETPERIMQRFMSYLLNELTKGDVHISPRDLRSSKNDNPVSKEIIELLKSDEIADILKFFEDNIIFSNESNPTGIYKFCRLYAEDHGTIHYKKGKYKDEFGELHETSNVFDYYEPNNKNEYVIPIIDTINLIDTERGMNTKQAMDKLSEYLAKYLRNRYNQSPVVIQQQAFEQEGNESFKLNKIRPSVAGLGDSKYTSRDSNVVLGLFSPARFGLQEYMGYNITKFKDNIRFLEVIVNRDGEMGGIIALFFDGAVCNFKELPGPKDVRAINKVYDYLDKVRGITEKVFFAYSKNNEKKLQEKNLISNFVFKLKNIFKV